MNPRLTASRNLLTSLEAGRRLAVALVVMIVLLACSKAIASYLGMTAVSVALPPLIGIVLVILAGSRCWLRPGLVSVMLLVASASLGNGIQDATWDGNMYHKPATVALHDGWNPWRQEFFEWTRSRTEPYYAAGIWEGNDNNKWISHYPNISWLYGASLMDFGFGWESTKSLGTLLCLAVFLFGASVLTALTSCPRLSVAIALMLALCPPLLAQLATNYVDGATYAAMALIVLACLAPRSQQGDNPTAWCGLILLAGMKFTGALYGGLLALPFLAIRRPSIKEVVGWALVGTFLLSHPYINHLVAGLPIAHPVTGNTQVMANQAEPSMLEGARPVTLARSLFARTSNTFSHPGLKIPGDIGNGEVDASGIPDTRYGGFGPLFSLALLLALCALPPLVVTRACRRNLSGPQKWLLTAAGYLLLLTLMHAAPWWARYVPFLYMAVVCCLMAALLSARPSVRMIAAAGVFILVANTALVVQGVSRYTRSAAFEAGKDIDIAVLEAVRDDDVLILQAPPFVAFSAVYHFGNVLGIKNVIYQPTELEAYSCDEHEDLGSWIRLVHVCRKTMPTASATTRPEVSSNAQ